MPLAPQIPPRSPRMRGKRAVLMLFTLPLVVACVACGGPTQSPPVTLTSHPQRSETAPPEPQVQRRSPTPDGALGIDYSKLPAGAAKTDPRPTESTVNGSRSEPRSAAATSFFLLPGSKVNARNRPVPITREVTSDYR